jgi:hypothetical protein
LLVVGLPELFVRFLRVGVGRHWCHIFFRAKFARKLMQIAAHHAEPVAVTDRVKLSYADIRTLGNTLGD